MSEFLELVDVIDYVAHVILVLVDLCRDSSVHVIVVAVNQC